MWDRPPPGDMRAVGMSPPMARGVLRRQLAARLWRLCEPQTRWHGRRRPHSAVGKPGLMAQPQGVGGEFFEIPASRRPPRDGRRRGECHSTRRCQSRSRSDRVALHRPRSREKDAIGDDLRERRMVLPGRLCAAVRSPRHRPERRATVSGPFIAAAHIACDADTAQPLGLARGPRAVDETHASRQSPAHAR